MVKILAQRPEIVYMYWNIDSDYETDINIFIQIYVKPKNEIFSRHLSTGKQIPVESID